MKTITCSFYGIHAMGLNQVDLILFADQFPERGGHRRITVRCQSVHPTHDGKLDVEIGTYAQRRHFQIRLRKSRRSA